METASPIADKLCPGCKCRMALRNQEYTKPGHALQTFKCVKCGHVESEQRKEAA
jgi:Zn ribbon nucleic-acid-binding protein